MDTTQLLYQDEGYRQFPYKDTVGKLTIGIGFNLDDTGLSKEESLAVLGIRITHLINDHLSKLKFWKELNEVRRAVLIDVAYNLGIDGLLAFRKMFGALQNKDYEKASEELLDSKAATQLATRYNRLAKMLKTGAWVK